MEYYQQIQNRAGQTVAVVNEYLHDLKVGTTSAGDLESQSEALDTLAQNRDNAIAAYDQANNAENMGFLALRQMTLALPRAAEGQLDDNNDTESGLLDLFDEAYGIQPRTTEAAIERGRKVVSALNSVNTYLRAQSPPREPITSGGKNVSDLTTALDGQPELEQAVENKAADVKNARNILHSGARAVDRLRSVSTNCSRPKRARIAR